MTLRPIRPDSIKHKGGGKDRGVPDIGDVTAEQGSCFTPVGATIVLDALCRAV